MRLIGGGWRRMAAADGGGGVGEALNRRNGNELSEGNERGTRSDRRDSPQRKDWSENLKEEKKEEQQQINISHTKQVWHEQQN